MKIHPNFTSYLHPVNETGASTSPFLLFNPSIHFWIAVNEAGADIVRALQNGATLEELAAASSERGMAADEFDAVVVPFVEQLLALRFFGLEPTPASRSWVPKGFSLEQPEDYPFDDIIVSLGDRCNLACTYCFNADDRQGRLQQGNALRRLTRDDVRRVLRQFAELGGKGVVFTGGEPTLNAEFLGFCEDAKQLDLTVNVITNGTRLKNLDAHRFVNAVDAVAVSLDSFDDQINARLWQVNRVDVAEDILRPLAAIGRLRNRRGNHVRIVIKPTITQLNLLSLKRLFGGVIDALEGCRVSFDISLYEKLGKHEQDLELSISRESLERELHFAAEEIFKRSGSGASDASIAIAAESFALSCAGKLGAMDRPRILSCAPSLFVTNTGDVYPCQSLEVEEFRLGNVYEGSLRDMFHQQRFTELRRSMTRDDIEVCRDCEFRYVCVEHCHGCSFKGTCRTTAFTKADTSACRARTIKRLWLETQKRERPS